MNILVLNGSPKVKSDTMVLTNAFIEGIKQTGDHNITIMNIREKQIAACRGCFGCWQMGKGECVINDDQNEILKLYPNMDVIIWSFPLYCYGMPSPLKAVLDRVIPLNQMKMEIVDGKTRHVPFCDFSRIHTVVISGSGFPNYEHNFEGLDLQVHNAFGNLTTVYVPETPMLNIPEAKIVAEPKAARFTQAGEEYMKNFSLSKQTIDELQSLMIPMEDYIAHINGNH